jgi:hypothetical protein
MRIFIPTIRFSDHGGYD